MAKANLYKTVSPMFLGASYFHQTHLMLYNDNSLPFLGASLGSNLPIDMFLGRSNARKWVPVRLLATQADGESDVGHAFKEGALLYRLSCEMLDRYSIETHFTRLEKAGLELGNEINAVREKAYRTEYIRLRNP